MSAEPQLAAFTPPAFDADHATPAIDVKEASKLFGNFAALRHVTLTLPPGSCTMLLGENGAGKSTLLRLVSGLITPSRGSVAIFGGSPREMASRLAYVSHASMLYDELTAMENLQYFAALEKSADDCGCSGSPEMALRAVGLNPHLPRTVGQFSQGMRQRVSLARALQSDPDLLLLDEPFSNLDVAGAQQMIELLADFRTWPAKSGLPRTILLTTHQAHLANELANTVVTMKNGAIETVERRA